MSIAARKIGLTATCVDPVPINLDGRMSVVVYSAAVRTLGWQERERARDAT